MNTKKQKAQRVGQSLAAAMTAILFFSALGWAALPPGRETQITREETGLALVWRGISNAAYIVEQRTNLLTGAFHAWPSAYYPPFSGKATWPIAETNLPGQFFRVMFPKPELGGGEPAFVPEAGGTTVYVTGRYFYEGDQIRVDGVLLSNVVFISDTLLSGELPDLAPGLHDIDVLGGQGGGVLAALPGALEVTPPPERRVQGPPEWPLAGPAAALDWRGHVTVLKSHGGDIDQDCDGTDDDCDDIAGHVRGHVTVLKNTEQDCDGRDDDCNGGVDLYLHAGEVRQQIVDLAVPGRGLDFVWGRTYRSRTGVASAQGNRWTHSYDVTCTQNSAGGMDVCDGTGRKDVFRAQTNGTYTCPEFFREGKLDPALSLIRLTFADTGYWEFKPFDASPAAGKLAHIVDRNGNTLTLAYDVAGRLAEIVDDLGRTNTVAYTPAGQVASVTDFSGRTVTYAYYGEDDPDGLPGDLKSVTSPAVIGTSTSNDFPSGKTTTYTYTTNGAAGAGSLLLSIIDPQGHTNVQCTYDLNPASATFARCLSLQGGTNLPTCVTYLSQTPAPDNRFAALRCIVNDPEGNVAEHDFDLRNRCVALREYTGRAEPGAPVTASENRPTGKLRADDPELFETTWSWNNDSLCTAQTLPRGDRTEWVYQAELDPATPPRFRANLRTERRIALGDLDGDGDIDAVVRSFEHDPRFGSSVAARRPKGDRIGLIGFGSFTISKRGARIGRNPQTGKEIKIAAKTSAPTSASLAIKTKGTSAQRKTVAKFKAGAALADTVKSRVTSSGHGDTCDDEDCDDFAARAVIPVGNSMAIKEKGTGADKNRVAGGGDDDCDDKSEDVFVTHVVNPLGFETRCEYDARGNRTALTRHGGGGSPDAPPVLAREDFEYNVHGQLTAHVHAEDAQGLRRRDVCVYYETGPQAGYLQSIAIDEQGAHLTTSYAHDARGNVTNTVDPRGTATEIEVNALDQTVAAATQGASTSERVAARFFYDAANNLVGQDVENRAGDGTLDPTNAFFTTLCEYDVLHQLTRLVEECDDPGDLTSEFAYNGNGQLVLARSPLAVQGGDPFHATRCDYDERGLLFRATRAPGSPLQATTQCDYDPNGNLRATRTGIEDADGVHVTEYAYDVLGRRVRVTDPMGNETRSEYDLNDNVTRVVHFGETNDVPGNAGNIRLADTRYEYDALDRVILYWEPFFDVFTQAPLGDGGRETSITYAPNGLVTATTNDRGHGTTYTFDTTMFLTGIVDAKSNRVDYTYDANGNLLSATETGHSDLGGPDEILTRTFTYDALDRCVADWDNVGNTNRYAYDSRGNPVHHIDPLGYYQEGDFDGISRPTSNRKGVGGSAQNTTRIVWDAASRLVADVDGNTNTTEYMYDSLDRLVRKTQADGTSQTNAYDVHGNLVWTRDANGTEIFLAYDLLDRYVQKTIIPGPGVAASTTQESYAYDGLSHLVRAANNQTEVTCAYDSLGRRVHEATAAPALELTYQKIEWSYDAYGLLLSQTLPSGRVVEYSYDALDRPISLGWRTNAAALLEPLAAYAYAGPERLARVTRANGVQTDYAYSGLAGAANPPDDYGWGQIQRVRHTLGGTNVIDDRLFAYDRNQNKTLRALLATFTPYGPTNHQEFVYDSLDRLVHSVTTTNGVIARDTTYSLDAMGNRLLVLRDGAAQPYLLDRTLPVPGDFQVNQYTATPFDARQYDENGNLHSTETGGVPPRQFVYDYDDRLVAVQDASGPVAAYAYDPLGRRIAKIQYAGLPPVPVLTNRYLYADGQLIEEEDGDGAVQRSFIMPHVLEQSGAIIDGNGAVLYTHSDDQGSLLALTDAKGDVVERFDYDDYGAPGFLSAAGEPEVGLDGQPLRASAVGAPELFHGMRWDEETGLYWDGDGNPSSAMNKGELIDAMAKEAGLSVSPSFDPVTGRGLSRSSTGNNPYSLKKEEGGRHTPFANRMISGALPGGAILSAAVSSLSGAGGGSGGGGKAQDHNSSRSNKSASLFGPAGGGGSGGLDNLSGTAKKVAKFKAGAALAESVR